MYTNMAYYRSQKEQAALKLLRAEKHQLAQVQHTATHCDTMRFLTTQAALYTAEG